MSTPGTSCGTRQQRKVGLTAVDSPAAQVLATAHCLQGSQEPPTAAGQGPSPLPTKHTSILAQFYAPTINPLRQPAGYRFFVVMLMPKLSIIRNDVSSFGFFVIASM